MVESKSSISEEVVRSLCANTVSLARAPQLSSAATHCHGGPCDETKNERKIAQIDRSVRLSQLRLDETKDTLDASLRKRFGKLALVGRRPDADALDQALE